MHEMGIASSILHAVASEAGRHPGSRPVRVGVKIGELAAVDAECLRFAFEVLVQGTEHEGLQLDIEIVPRRHSCPVCGQQFVVRNYDFECPRCHAVSVDFAGGDELDLAFVELEENGPSTAGTKSTE
ncbi:MAG: hydrogenase maturation nickel metallochaperone HypA [Candidatus Korobacteraceae bacterium]|jgi:hydrogenase nickel incorporation protein HypA/HybF